VSVPARKENRPDYPRTIVLISCMTAAAGLRCVGCELGDGAAVDMRGIMGVQVDAHGTYDAVRRIKQRAPTHRTLAIGVTAGSRPRHT